MKKLGSSPGRFALVVLALIVAVVIFLVRAKQWQKWRL